MKKVFKIFSEIQGCFREKSQDTKKVYIKWFFNNIWPYIDRIEVKLWTSMCYLIRGKFIKKHLKTSHKSKLSLLSIYWNYQKEKKNYTFFQFINLFMSTQKYILLTEISSNKVFWQATREICWVTHKLGAPQVETIFFDSLLTCLLRSAAPGGISSSIPFHFLVPCS